MEELTNEQRESLKTWAGQRDSILSEILNLKATREGLISKNKELAVSNTDIETRTNEVRGRIEELKIKERELPLLILKEVAILNSKKSVLESEIPILKNVIEILTIQKESLKEDVFSALSTFQAVKGETSMLERIVEKVTEVSSGNTAKIDLLVENLAKSLEEIIEVNKKNVKETNLVIEKVPAMIMEAQKRGLIKNKL